jgi:hypothetical protein
VQYCAFLRGRTEKRGCETKPILRGRAGGGRRDRWVDFPEPGSGREGDLCRIVHFWRAHREARLRNEADFEGTGRAVADGIDGLISRNLDRVVRRICSILCVPSGAHREARLRNEADFEGMGRRDRWVDFRNLCRIGRFSRADTHYVAGFMASCTVFRIAFERLFSSAEQSKHNSVIAGGVARVRHSFPSRFQRSARVASLEVRFDVSD